MIELRRLAALEIDEVAALSARCFPGSGFTAAELAGELERAFAEVWVARDDARIAGYAVAWFVGDDGEVLTLGTDPHARRRGLGRALVARLQLSARERGVRSLTLEVRESNAAARALYDDAGFETVGVRRRYYADGEDARVMTWRP